MALETIRIYPQDPSLKYGAGWVVNDTVALLNEPSDFEFNFTGGAPCISRSF